MEQENRPAAVVADVVASAVDAAPVDTAPARATPHLAALELARIGWAGWRARLPLLLHAYRRASVVGALLVLALAVWLIEPFGTRATLGEILVDTPEIYTRERLVNDRFLQDAWLSRELELEPAAGSQTMIDRRGTRGAIGVSALPSAVGASDAAKPADNAGAAARASSRELLLEKLDYRDLVRNLAIENQLDDRHDLHGNSLYKLKFDAAILPGANTQASARIEVKVIAPAFLSRHDGDTPLRSVAALSAKDQESWQKIYRKWIENLGTRLNQTQQELKQAYQNNEFAHNDYARLIAFLSRTLEVPLKAVKGCPPEAAELRGGHERAPTRLTGKAHAERKACIDAIVRSTIQRSPVQPAAGNVGRYTTGVAAAGTAPNTPEQVTIESDALNYRLDAYFATKTVQLVLGLSMPDSSFVSGSYHALPAFKSLVQLAFFNPFPKAADENVFTVKERVAAIAAIDAKKVTPEVLAAAYQRDADYWSRVYETNGTPALTVFGDFAPNTAVGGDLSVSTVDLWRISQDDLDLSRLVFKDVSGGAGVRVATVEAGLLNFIRLARKHALAHTYAVTPKDSSDSVSVVLATETGLAAEVPGQASAVKATLNMGRAVTTQSLERRNAVVGFSAATNDGSAGFGWFISARHHVADGQKHVLVQPPAQYSLSALVSLPSWWSEAQLKVTTSWIGPDGNALRGTRSVTEHAIDIPTDFEPLEANLLGIEQLGPELMESRLDPILLTACHSGAIIIPGRRLWRSTKVTLGYQTAQSIAVLPNMKGIIARFPEVWNQTSLGEDKDRKDRKDGGPQEISRLVRVWTSQGSLTLPAPARIGIPPDDCPITKERTQ